MHDGGGIIVNAQGTRGHALLSSRLLDWDPHTTHGSRGASRVDSLLS